MTGARKPRRRRWLWRSLLLVAGVIGAQFALEWVLHTWDVLGVNYPAEIGRYRLTMWDFDIRGPADADRLDGILFKHKPGARQQFGSFEVAVNSLGFRGPEVAAKKPAGTYRIVVLGDSVAFGWGVNDEVTFLRRLEHDLNARGDGRKYEVVNTGHPMYDTVQELAMLRDHGLALDPDLVLLVFVVNDIQPTRDVFQALLDAEAGKAPELTTAQRISLWYAGMFPASATLLDHFSTSVPAEYRDPDAPAPDPPEKIGPGVRGWERSQESLLAMQELCAKRSIPFLVLDHSLPAVQALPGFCAEHGIAYADLRFTTDELSRPIYNSAIDPHANALGHELLLAKLKRALGAAGLPP